MPYPAPPNLVSSVKRASGLIVPTEYNPVVGDVIQPVLVLSGASGRGGVPGSSSLVTPAPAGGYFGQPLGDNEYMCMYHQSTTGATATITKTHTCPAGEVQLWHAVYMTFMQDAGSNQTIAAAIRVNPLSSIAGSYGAGKIDLVGYAATNRVSGTFYSLFAHFGVNGTTSPLSNGGSFDGDATHFVNAGTVAGFPAPLKLTPGGQIQFEVSGTSIDTLIIYAFFSVRYV